MGSMRFGEFADSPTVFLPPQEHPFFPSSHTHLIQHHQPFKPVTMEPDSAVSPHTKSANGISQEPSRSSRKRRHDESSSEPSIAEYVKPMDPLTQRLGTPGRSDGEVVTDVAIPHGLATSYESRTETWLDGVPEQSVGDFPDDVTLSSNQGAEDRRKFQRQEASQTPDDITGNTSSDQPPSREGVEHDEMAVDLGVGWRSPELHPNLKPQALAAAKYIEKHYPLNNVEVIAVHRNMLKLARTSTGLWIFGDETTRGAFLAHSWRDCINEIWSRQAFVWDGLQLYSPARLNTANQPLQPTIEEIPARDMMPMEDTEEHPNRATLPMVGCTRQQQVVDFQLHTSPSGGSNPEDWKPDLVNWNPDHLYPNLKSSSPLREEESAGPSDESQAKLNPDSEMDIN
ncbi:MAG: hypothetical protein LQ346_002330 [Caloplaca aetnensis]|nr:MAG: hypothetical protein LQ346_002330 [Caloplaca aetnensis]